LGADESVEVWIKRDDETGLVTSGNKIRKLQFLLADAVQQERDCVVTIGTRPCPIMSASLLWSHRFAILSLWWQAGGNRTTVVPRQRQRESWASNATSS
jgi:hypothetical protein